MAAIEFDNHQSADEGWVVSDCDGSENGPWQIQKLDHLAMFPSDGDAWRHVITKADEGSAYHQAALDFIREHNPIEANAIAIFRKDFLD